MITMRSLVSLPTTFLLFAIAVQAAHFDKLTIFGDSLSDSGNGYQIYQVAPDFFPPNPPMPVAPNYQTGEFTSGPATSPASTKSGLWIEQLAPQLGLPVPQPGVLGAFSGQPNAGSNFAIAGTQTGFSLADMGGQVNYYVSSRPNGIPARDLYVLWGGANDIVLNAADPNAASTAVSNIQQQIEMLAGAGGKYFLWVNMLPIDQAPGVRAQGAASQAVVQQQVEIFNTAWSSALEKLKEKYPGVEFAGLDVHALYSQILADPSAYGLTNVTDPSQGNPNANPDQYLYWDVTHPTAAAHGLIADYARETIEISYAPEPATAAMFGAGVVLAAALGKRRYSRRLPR